MAKLDMRKWINLLDYYHACLERERLKGVSLSPKSEGERFISNFEYEDIFCSSDPQSVIPKDAGTQEFMRKIQLSRFRRRLFYGYPAVLNKVRTEHREEMKVSALFFVEVTWDETDTEYIFTPEEDRPDLNYAILREHGIQYEEIESIMGEEKYEGVGEEEEGISPEKRFLNRVERIQNRIRLAEVETLVPEKLDNTPPLSEANEEGIYNRAILFHSEGLGYTLGTLAELERLKKEEHWEGVKASPLGLLLARDHQNEPVHPGPILCITPFSDEQKNAVRSGLQNCLTVVTGPPGTGKSQLVLNLIANAIVQDKTVLFASKNNKAVDIVCKWMSQISDDPVILRTGKREYREDAFRMINNIAEGMSSEVGVEAVTKAGQAFIEAGQWCVKIDRQIETRASLEKKLLELDEHINELRKNIPSKIFEIMFQTEGSLFGERSVLFFETILDQALRYLSGHYTLLERIQLLFNRERLRGKLAKGIRSTLEDVKAPLDLSISDEVSLTDLIEILKKIQLYIELDKNVTELKMIRDEFSRQPSFDKLGKDLEDHEKKLQNASRDVVLSRRRNQLYRLPRDKRLDLEQYIECISKLELPDLGRLYYSLKREEKRLFSVVQEVFPIWAITNLSVKRNLPLVEGLFDLVVIDEASQCDIPSAIPLLYRAKQAVIIGDDKQLIHVTSINEGTDKILAQRHNILGNDYLSFSYRSISLFHLARGVLRTDEGTIFLDEHYRSHPDIINFSKEEFYNRHNRRLKIYTEPSKLVVKVDQENPAVRWVDIRGETIRPSGGSAYNSAEADRVIEILHRVLQEMSNKAFSLGVVTPFRKQAVLLRSKLVKLQILDDLTQQHDFIVDTAHRFQGDERDIMIFSPVISKGAGRYRYTIQFANNPNLFNVAITRARSLLYVVGDKEYCKKTGECIGNFACYIDELLDREVHQRKREGIFESPLEEELYRGLKQRGIDAIPQYNVVGSRLDLAVITPKVMLDIECDGLHHEGYDGKRRKSDLIRDRKLKRANWKVLRFWSFEIRDNLEGCLRQIEEVIM